MNEYGPELLTARDKVNEQIVDMIVRSEVKGKGATTEADALVLSNRIDRLVTAAWNEAIDRAVKKAESMASFDGNMALGASELRGLRR